MDTTITTARTTRITTAGITTITIAAGKLFLALGVLCASSVFAFNEVANGDELRSRLGLSQLNLDLSQVKVAVLDNGFRGFVPNKGMLPASSKLIDAPLKLPETSAHGLGMAQILWEVTGKSQQGPKIYLLNSNGFTNFKAAVDFVIANKIDIVLYSQVWTFGSNFDGKGFINDVVNRATAAGVIWINAAGNLGGQVYNGQGTQTVRIENLLDDNSFTLTLSWADFAESSEVCSLQDYDLELIDESGKLIRSSTLVQSGVSPDPKDPKDQRSCYARESIQVNGLERGTYTARIISKNGNADFRLILTENKLGSLEFVGTTSGMEIMPPADNASVFTVGEKTPFSAMGPTADGRVKPDVVIENAQVSFTNGTTVAGSSNAAAMVAGAVAVLKGKDSSINGDWLIDYGHKLRARVVIPAGLVKVNVSDWIKTLIPFGGVVRQDPGTYRLVILSREVPTQLPLLQRFNLQLRKKDDIVACHESLSFCQVFPKTNDFDIKPPMIEFRQYSYGGSLNTPALWVHPR